MPIYSYRCESCGHAQDVLQKISDPLLSDCPKCGQAAFRKQLTAAGFQLKGSGWYVTDFRGGSSGASTATATASAATKEGGEASSSSASASSGASDAPASTAAAGGCGTSCACH